MAHYGVIYGCILAFFTLGSGLGRLDHGACLRCHRSYAAGLIGLGLSLLVAVVLVVTMGTYPSIRQDRIEEDRIEAMRRCARTLLTRRPTSNDVKRDMKNRSTESLRVAVVGGGIGGLSAAHALRRRGMDVTVYEQAKSAGRSRRRRFHLSQQLASARTHGPVVTRWLERSAPGSAAARQYYRMDGTVVGPILTTDSCSWNGMYGMHRADLLDALARGAALKCCIRTDHRCIGFEQDDTWRG